MGIYGILWVFIQLVNRYNLWFKLRLWYKMGQNLKLIEAAVPAKIIARGETLKIQGDKEEVKFVNEIIIEIWALLFFALSPSKQVPFHFPFVPLHFPLEPCHCSFCALSDNSVIFSLS